MCLFLLCPALSFATASFDPATLTIAVPNVKVGELNVKVRLHYERDLLFKITELSEAETSEQPDIYNIETQVLHISGLVFENRIYELAMKYQDNGFFNLIAIDSVALPLMGSYNSSGHDDQHITFINQTRHKIKFTVNIQDGWDRRDVSKTIHSHEANYVNVDQFERHCKDSNGHKRSFEIKMDIGDTGNYNHHTHRRCGENLYVWYEGNVFHMNDEPHIEADLSGCDKDRSKPAILFAHGYNASQKDFGHMAYLAKKRNWRVFRTSVPQDGSISKRAHRLNAYISKAAKQCNIDEGTLRVAAHSMGGLDVRYIVGENLSSAKYFEKVYTIATPHQGDTLSYFAFAMSDAARDLTPANMRHFNSAYTYSDFTEKNIGFLALLFKCGSHGSSDGVVSYDSQQLTGAPVYPENGGYIKARHTDGVVSALCVDVIEELHSEEVLNKILE